MLKTLVVGQPRIESDVLKYVVGDLISKSQEILSAGAGADTVADVGTVLGKRERGALDAAYAARAGNTGNFTNMFANPKVAPGAKVGVYAITFIAATRFRVEDPDGVELGEGTTGVAFTNGLKFTITAGGTAAVAGDAADITVTAAPGSGELVPIDFTATDGSQNFYAISLQQKTALDGGADQPIVVLKQLGCIVPSKLIWPAGATDQQKAGALAQAAAKFIVPLS